MNQSRCVVSGLALAGLAIISGATEPAAPPADPFGGTKVVADWQPQGHGGGIAVFVRNWSIGWPGWPMERLKNCW